MGCDEEEVLVTIKQGILRGQRETSPFGDVYYGFQGIPYAKPPIGELRFKPPQPAEKWTGIRDATKAQGFAPQLDLSTGEILKGSNEDCLYLHVYTTEIPQSDTKKPVMVWIHGGGYSFGSGNKDFYSPDYFMSHDIVFVSINYRLGALGFFSLKTLECPGNFGLKDQNLAIQWVQKNISHFGGDPDNVTIFGESAGASAVHYHLVSPLSKGLFQKAISQSSTSVTPCAFARHPRESGYLLGKKLGCNAENDEELLEFLKKVPVENIIKSQGIILHEVEGEKTGEEIFFKYFAFVPTVEPEHDNSFLTKLPLTDENQLDVPFITGVTDKEMIMEIYNPDDVPQWTENREFQGLIPRNLQVEKDSTLSLEIAKKIRDFYFKDGITVDSLIDVLSDTFFVHSVYRAVKHRLSNIIKSPTYLYTFSFDGKNGFFKKLLENITGKKVNIPGAAHGDEIGYLFTSKNPETPLVDIGSPEHETILRLTKLWVEFATSGAPTVTKETKWPPTEIQNDVVLDIGEELKLKNGFFRERMEFWDDIFKLAEQDV